MMDASEWYVRLCGEVGNFTEATTGVSIVDAFFGPQELSPSCQRRKRSPESMLSDLGRLQDSISSQTAPATRRDYLLGEARSLETAIRWLTTDELSYLEAVSSLFNINARKFPESEVNTLTDRASDALQWVKGATVAERARNYTEAGQVEDAELRNLILSELQPKADQICTLFRERIYSLIGQAVTDNGVLYEAVQNKPWSGYNYYRGGYQSLNQFNTDRPMNRNSLLSVVYHEYEHHVANLWREKAFHEGGCTELAIVPLHTGRCVISEGTADSAREFLGIVDDSLGSAAFEALYGLRRMVSLNAAVMLNDEGCTTDEASSYVAQYGLRDLDAARRSLDFLLPCTTDGKRNFWAPYVFTYMIGRRDFVAPAYEKARRTGALAEFFRVLYTNPFSRSSVTWNSAFDWLNH